MNYNGRFDPQNINIGHNSNDRTTHDIFRGVEQILSCTMFCGQKIILVFQTTCSEDKKLSCGSLKDKSFNFCSVFSFCLSDLKNNFKIKHSTTKIVLSNPFF
jgi:hypothetical protein